MVINFHLLNPLNFSTNMIKMIDFMQKLALSIEIQQRQSTRVFAVGPER
jgi:hypothetical protein